MHRENEDKKDKLNPRMRLVYKILWQEVGHKLDSQLSRNRPREETQSVHIFCPFLLGCLIFEF